MSPVDEVIELLRASASDSYLGEPVSQLAHAEQCAWHAEQAGADDELIVAALLHDIGHLLGVPEGPLGVIDHDGLGARWLRERGFSERLVALVGGHVRAKRYLTGIHPAYYDTLSPASRETLRLQGGPMAPPEAARFACSPFFYDTVRLRSIDELAKDPNWTGPRIDSYRERLLRSLS